MQQNAILLRAALALALALPSLAANSVSNTTTHAVHTTLSAALAALEADGQTLVLAPGAYTEPELLIQWAVTLQGADAASTFLQPATTPGAAASRVATVDIPPEYAVELPVIFERLSLRHGNTAGNGGALLVHAGDVLLRHCAVSNNLASGQGGGLFCMSSADASLSAEECVLARNAAGTQGGGAARGSYLRCTFTANNATDGGASAYAALEACTLTDNTASGQGGGLYLGSATRCTLRRNSALYGGGAFRTALASSLLAANTAGQSGGGLYLGGLTNCTLLANSAATAGGGLFGSAAANTILYNNTAPSGADYDPSATLAYSRAVPLAPGTGNIIAYPRFRDPDADNYSLLSHSPCVNTGHSPSAPSGADLAGNTRVQGAAVEMGAYEHDPAIIDYLGFEQWLHRNALPIDAAGQFALDHNGDGIPNAFAYAFGTNRIDGSVLAIRRTEGGLLVAETPPQQQESVGNISLWVEATGLTADTPPDWTNATPVAPSPAGALRFRSPAPDADVRGFFRLKADLP